MDGLIVAAGVDITVYADNMIVTLPDHTLKARVIILHL